MPRFVRPLFAAALLVLSAASLVLGLVTPAEGDPEPRTAVPLVPLWSARRLPFDLAEAAGAMQLPQKVQGTLDGLDACFVLREGRDLIHSLNPSVALIPASTQKLLTAAASLHVLGPDTRFETVVRASEDPPAGGRVERVWLVGGGDPVLATGDYAGYLDEHPFTAGHVTTPLERLADEMVARGVRSVGAVLADAGRHSGPPTVPTWKPGYIADRDVPYLAALAVNGGWSAWDPVTVTAPDPAVEAAAQLRRLLELRGVTVEADPARGSAPARAPVVARVTSPHLTDIVATMIRESDNLIAELLTRELGLARAGVGDTPHGTTVIVDALGELGIDATGVALTDGSGLDRGNRATCRAVFGALRLRDREGFGALDEGLAVAGQTGTLHRRYEHTPLDARLRAKTGSLLDVTGLVGVLERGPDEGPPGIEPGADLTFSLIANGPFGVRGGQVQDAMVEVLRGFPFRFSDAALLAPPAARPHRVVDAAGSG